MNKVELINSVARKTNLDRAVVDKALSGSLDEIVIALQQKQEVHLAGFGTFLAKDRHARMGVNPLKPKERIQMPATVVPKFKSGKTLKDALKPGAQKVTQKSTDAEKKESSAESTPTI